MADFNPELLKRVLEVQRNEITEYHIYVNLAQRIKDAHNKEVLDRIAVEEKGHYDYLFRHTKTEVQPDRLRIWWYTLISRIFGLSFGLRLMERGEADAVDVYRQLGETVPRTAELLLDEQRHETEVLDMIEEERIAYAGAMVLGLNDALVELTGALAGLTFALQNGKLVAVTGFITGIAASMSMASSQYLSSREDADRIGTKNPLKSAVYTGVAYVVTVLLLIMPYLTLGNVYLALAIMLALSIGIVFSYNFYITTAKNLKFWRRFIEMTVLSLSVALISFVVGLVIRHFFNVEV